MLRKHGKQLVSIALSSALALGAFAAPFSTNFVQAETTNIKVQLLGVNDLHGQLDYKESLDLDKDGTKETPIGGIEYLAAYLKAHEKENPNTLIVHSGDMVGGSPLISAAFQDEPTIEILEAMGFDVGTLGNHEFDEGIAELRRMVNGGDHPKGTKGYDGIDFPMIAANVYDKSDGKLILEPYAIKEIGGAKIGFIGVTTQETPSMIVQTGNENLQVTDEVEAINKYTKELQAKGIQAIVVLAHNPTWQDNNNSEFDAGAIAEKVDDAVDVIFAAHNHVEVNKVVDGKLIVQAQSYAKAFADVDLEIDPTTGDIVKKEATVHQVFQNKYEADPTVTAILKKYEDMVNEVKAVVVGEAKAEMAGKYPARGASGDHGIGNLIADGMKAAMNADFAMMNGGGVRAALDAGPITFGDLFTIQPFGNTIVKTYLTGAEIRQVLNNQITAKGLDFQISGFKYTWNGKSNKIVDIMLPDGTKIDESKEYSVVVNNYMFGNAQYEIGKLADGKFEQGPEDIEATVNFVKSLQGPIDYKSEGRISEVIPTFTPFVDVPADHWAYGFVTDLREREAIKGTTDTTFSPDAGLTRAQFASLIVRALGLKAGDAAVPFKDIAKVAQGTQAEIAAAFQSGIIVGTSETTFEPSKPITRAQMATMMIRAYNHMNKVEYKAKDAANFTDIAGLDAEVQNAVSSAKELGFIQGYGELFKPGQGATRAQGAKLLSLILTAK
ncbi:5'-nucleotidase C-terminal domain-containing protein [Pseudoneobacillus sp. C159]